MKHTLFKTLLSAGLVALTTLTAHSAFIQLTPFGAPPGGIVDTNYIEFSSNSSAQHFEELDTWFVVADLILTAESGQNNTGNPNFAVLDTSNWQYMVVRYEKNGPSPDLIGAFDLNSVASVSAADLIATEPDHVTGYDHKQVYLYNSRVDNTTTVPEGGATVALLGLALGGLGAARRFMSKQA